MPIPHWHPVTTFTTTARDDRSPRFPLIAGLIIVEYTCTLLPGRLPPYFALQIDHARTGLEYHSFIINYPGSPTGVPVTERRPVRITHPGPYTIGIHTDSVARATVRLLRPRL